VASNDFLTFPTVIADATVVNQEDVLTPEDIDRICGPAADDRDFIRSTFDGLYFTAEDRAFLDAAWSHVDHLPGHKRALAISTLVLAAARNSRAAWIRPTPRRATTFARDFPCTGAASASWS